MRKFFRELISDNNTINEQTFVGVISFFAMLFVLVVDVITGILGNELTIKEFIFDGFMIIVLGTFSITTTGRIIKSNKKSKKDNELDK